VTAEPRQHVVLCEGYEDRSFWKGWLLNLRCTDPSDGGKRPVNDAWGRPVKGSGRYLFRTPSGSDVLVQPFQGRANARRAVEEYLGGKQTYRPQRVVLNLDSDGANEGDTSAEDQIHGIAQALGADGPAGGPYEAEESVLYPVIWRCGDAEPAPGLPKKQTLERLVAAAICAAHPDRGPAVKVWLEAEPHGLALPKSYSYSYFAKWYADRGAGSFYEHLWQDEAVAAELKKRLEATGSWATVEALVSD
jgi:hypothetical protein